MAEAPRTRDPQFLPSDIPIPQDDGAARHLAGMRLADRARPATSGAAVNLSKLKGRTVAAGMTLLERMALGIDDGVITRAFYPVVPRDKKAEEAAAWLKAAKP